jgi:hypothetical protein
MSYNFSTETFPSTFEELFEMHFNEQNRNFFEEPKMLEAVNAPWQGTFNEDIVRWQGTFDEDIVRWQGTPPMQTFSLEGLNVPKKRKLDANNDQTEVFLQVPNNSPVLKNMLLFKPIKQKRVRRETKNDIIKRQEIQIQNLSVENKILKAKITNEI